jgi:surface antigen
MVSTAGPLGHVAFVESVDPITGAWTISEMNVLGLNMTDTRTLSASVLPSYSFIHDQISLGSKP